MSQIKKVSQTKKMQILISFRDCIIRFNVSVVNLAFIPNHGKPPEYSTGLPIVRLLEVSVTICLPPSFPPFRGDVSPGLVGFGGSTFCAVPRDGHAYVSEASRPLRPIVTLPVSCTNSPFFHSFSVSRVCLSWPPQRLAATPLP